MSARMLVCLSLALSFTAYAETPSQIESIMLYPDGAIVTRVADLSLPAGQSTIQLTGLVRALDAQSVRLSVDDTNVRIGQVQRSSEQDRESRLERVTALEARIAEKQDEIEAITDRSNAARLRLKFLESLSQGYAKGSVANGGSLAINDMRQVLSLLQDEFESASEFVRANTALTEPLQKDLSQLQRQLGEIRGGGLESTTLSVALSSPRATTTRLRFSYFQRNAGWHPIYEARLDSETGRLELTQKAGISQETAEAWQNVKLTLSTSNPSMEMEAPGLEPEFVSLGRKVLAAERDVARARMAMQDTMLEEEVIVTGSRAIAVVSDFAVSYQIPGTATIPNDFDEETTLDLSAWNFETDLVTVIVPSVSTDAFLQATVAYEEEEGLIAGELKVFVDGAFVGVGALPEVLQGDSLRLPMGQDRRISVAVRPQGGEDSTRGILNKTRTEITDLVYDISNSRQTPTLIEVLDRLPVSRDRDITVEVTSNATAPTERDMEDQPGMLLWRKEVEAGGNWQIRHAYTIRYPDGERVVRR